MVRQVSDNAVLWRRSFDGQNRPDFATGSDSDDLLVIPPLSSSYAKRAVAAASTLAIQASALRHKEAGHLVEVLSGAAGQTARSVVVELPAGTRALEMVAVCDDLYLGLAANLTRVCSMATGVERRQFFGEVAAIDRAHSNVCVLNRRDELLVLDGGGAERLHLHLDSPRPLCHVSRQRRQPPYPHRRPAPPEIPLPRASAE